MNAVQDRDQKYITRGWEFWHGLHVFRKYRIPDLAPAYKRNELESRALMGNTQSAQGKWVLRALDFTKAAQGEEVLRARDFTKATQGKWVLQPRDFTKWNTGWAKLVEVIESYEVRVSNELLQLGIAKEGGSLEVVSGRIALVVSKHWILLLGLLGRYGTRKDKGVLQSAGIRRDLHGERAAVRNFAAESDIEDFGGNEWFLRRKARSWTGSSSSSSEDHSMSVSRSEIEKENMKHVLTQRGFYGGWIGTFGKDTQSTMHGITGTMQAVGRNKGNWNYLSCVAFVPHTEREIFPLGIPEKGDRFSLQDQFWLAHGFFPCANSEDRLTVISMESPEHGINDAGKSSRKKVLSDSKKTLSFKLQPRSDIPISIGIAVICLGILPPTIHQFVQFEPADDIKFKIDSSEKENEAEGRQSRT